jgi:uncharacterized protein YndB with AHSA1/START domain
MQTGAMSGHAGRLVVELEAALPAPRERVFAALTERWALARWWGPAGFTTPAIELDLVVAGRYRFLMQPPEGEPFHCAGEFLEIAPPGRLAYTFRWEEPDPDDRDTVVRMSLDGSGDTTALSLWHGDFATPARRDLHRDGWADSFEKLRQLLTSER